MTAYNNTTEDNYSRQVHPVLMNTAKDGSGTWYFALVDSDGHLQVDSLSALPAGTNVIGKVGHDVTGIGDGRETVDAAGTAQAIAASTVAKAVKITAETDNTDVICVGGSTVVEADATRRGMPLYPGESTPWIPCDNLADIFIDAAVQDEGVTFIYLT